MIRGHQKGPPGPPVPFYQGSNLKYVLQKKVGTLTSNLSTGEPRHEFPDALMMSFRFPAWNFAQSYLGSPLDNPLVLFGLRAILHSFRSVAESGPCCFKVVSSQ